MRLLVQLGVPIPVVDLVTPDFALPMHSTIWNQLTHEPRTRENWLQMSHDYGDFTYRKQETGKRTDHTQKRFPLQRSIPRVRRGGGVRVFPATRVGKSPQTKKPHRETHKIAPMYTILTKTCFKSGWSSIRRFFSEVMFQLRIREKEYLTIRIMVDRPYFDTVHHLERANRSANNLIDPALLSFWQTLIQRTKSKIKNSFLLDQLQAEARWFVLLYTKQFPSSVPFEQYFRRVLFAFYPHDVDAAPFIDSLDRQESINCWVSGHIVFVLIILIWSYDVTWIDAWTILRLGKCWFLP